MNKKISNILFIIASTWEIWAVVIFAIVMIYAGFLIIDNPPVCPHCGEPLW
jgi:hypothetical protein